VTITTATLRAEGRAGALATLRGCAQLAFCDSPAAGVLVLVGLAFVSPHAALGALVGSAFGTLAARFVPGYGREDWSWGLASFNPAIVGLLWDGLLASGEVSPLWLALPLATSMALDVLLRRLLARWMLPALSAAALLTVYLTNALVAPPGGWFWTDAPMNALLPWGVLGAACIFGAMMAKSFFAGLWALIAAAIAFLASYLAGVDPHSTAGLWAITVPLASFGLHAIFLRGSRLGCTTGTVAAVIAAALWIAWERSALGDALPPLLAPFILGVWGAALVMRKVAASPLADGGTWQALAAIARARNENREVWALVPSAAGAAASASPFVAGTWLDPSVPRSTFEHARLAASPRCRQAFWDACDRLRTYACEDSGAAATSPAGPIDPAIARALRAGCIDRVATCDAAVGSLDLALEAMVPLHGDLTQVGCLECGARSAWPPRGMWRRADLRCAACQGPVVPALTPFGLPSDVASLARLGRDAERCAVLLVLDDPPSDPTVEGFIAQMRRGGRTIVFAPCPARRRARREDELALSVAGERLLAYAIVLVPFLRLARRAPQAKPVAERARPAMPSDEGAG
jgi:urea transporter